MSSPSTLSFVQLVLHRFTPLSRRPIPSLPPPIIPNNILIPRRGDLLPFHTLTSPPSLPFRLITLPPLLPPNFPGIPYRGFSRLLVTAFFLPLQRRFLLLALVALLFYFLRAETDSTEEEGGHAEGSMGDVAAVVALVVV